MRVANPRIVLKFDPVASCDLLGATLIPWIFLVVTSVGAAFTANAFWPMGDHRRFFVPSFLFSWLTMELAAHHLVWQALATWLFWELGAMEAWPGWAGLGLSVLSWGGLAGLIIEGRRARGVVHRALSRAAIREPAHRFPWRSLLIPFPIAEARARRSKDIVYRRVAGRELELDVYTPDGRRHLRPAIVQVHGGAWVMGDKREQGIPLLVHLCQQGWVGFNVNYRLSPGATFPDQLVDLKAALAWIREHAEDFGVDPNFIAVTGGSAGGHLAALLALTANRPEYQPDFESADTSVQACVPLYAVFDLTNRLGARKAKYVDGFIGPVLIKAFFDEEPEKFHAGSPTDQIHASAPPFFVIHGDRDTMTPLEDARLFVERLRDTSKSPVLFAEIGGAQHAFDVFLSPRSAPVIEGVCAFLVDQHQAYLARATATPLPAAPSVEASARRPS